MKRPWTTLLSIVILFALGAPLPALAQENPPPAVSQEITLSTAYPSQVIGVDETVNLDLKVHAATSPHIVSLAMKQLPPGWSATFRGDGRAVSAAYVQADQDASVGVAIVPPDDISGGTYRFVAVASADGAQAELPIELTVKEKMPSRLSLDVELPTQKGTPKSTFRFNATLENEGDEDLTVNLSSEGPVGIEVAFDLSGTDITSLPLAANESKRLAINVDPMNELPAGQYPLLVIAQGGSSDAGLPLLVELTGQPELDVTTPDGRLSLEANAGRETPLKIVVSNAGNAPASAVQMNSSEPTGWTVEFSPQTIDEIPAGGYADVTAKLRPAEKAIAGDYEVTVSARPKEGTTTSEDFRVTVQTATLWGVVGIALIGAAVVVVALAVLRFGRR